MTSQEMRKKALELFAVQKLHCSQAIAVVGQEKLGRGNDEVIRAVGAFGGGLCGNGEVCGALVGALASVGLCYSRARQDEKEDVRMWKVADELFRRFRDEIVDQEGTIRCREIAGVDWKDRTQARAFYQSDKIKRCYQIVGETAQLLGEILEKNQ